MGDPARYQGLANYREQYAIRICNSSDQLVTNFLGLLESASFTADPEDLASVTRENMQVDLYSSNVVWCQETLASPFRLSPLNHY